MKTHLSRFRISLLIGLATILAIFITRPAASQETAKNESHKTIMLKVVSDDNGKTTVIDTVMEMNDSFMADSIQREIEKVIMLGTGGKHARIKYHNMPEGFSYNFDVPCPPDCVMDLDELEDLDFEGMAPCGEMGNFMWSGRDGAPGCKVIRSEGKGQSLSDMLGDIPMDRVVSYSIKDRKGGKRIVIDLNDAPMFEKQEKVIVIREPGRVQRNRNHGERQVKVIVNTDDDTKTEQTPPPPPPPPPPPAKTK
jgi:hypothetical protein